MAYGNHLKVLVIIIGNITYNVTVIQNTFIISY